MTATASRPANTFLPVPISRGLDPSSPAARLLAAFLSGRKAETIKAYKADLQDFQTFVKAISLSAAAEMLITRPPGDANALALEYKAALMDRKLASLTINRRLSALRALVKLARTLGMVVWSLEVQSLKAESYRDTRGPGRAGFRDMLDLLAKRKGAKATRDRAILRLLFDLGLRRAEVVGLDLADVDLEAATVAVLGKGRTSKVKLTMPSPTLAAVAAWVKLRGQDPGALFTSKYRSHDLNRITASGLYFMVRELGRKAGLNVWPHGLRHAAITEALDLTGGNVRAVQRFSRHRDVRVLERYDDNRTDLGGEVAKQVAASVPGVNLSL
jgi:integrase/recombinase XerC